MKNSSPTAMFWNFCGVSIVILSVSMFRATSFKLEAANQKLEVNRVVEQVKQVSDTLGQNAERLPKAEKEKIQQQLEDANYQLIETQQKILSNNSPQPTEP